MTRTFTILVALLLASLAAQAEDTRACVNFTTGSAAAHKFGVHEVVLSSRAEHPNPFDVPLSVTFTPPSGPQAEMTVQAFYDGDHTWRARLYVSEGGEWKWRSQCRTDAALGGCTGRFRALDSTLRGRLLIQPSNPRQWMTEDGRWFLNLNDTAYFLLCARDGNGDAVSDDDALRYVRDDVARGITSVRCFLAASESGFAETAQVWDHWFFTDARRDHLRLANLQCADRRLRMLLDQFPDVAVQLVMFPLAGYKTDDRFWAALSPAQRERLLRQLVARYAAYPQIFWLMVNDAHYGPGFPNNNALVREVGAWLQEHDPWQHPRSTGHARKVPFAFGGEDWATYIHIEHEHDLGALEYGRYHAFGKPVFLGEDRYEQDHGPRRDPAHMGAWQRRLFWAWLLSGGSASYGGRWWAVHPYGETGARATSYQKRPNTTFTQPLTGLDSVKAIRDYFAQRQINLGEFQPDHALAGSDNSARAPRVMRRELDEFLIYHPNAADNGQAARPDPAATATLRLDLRAARGTFQVEWYRAEDGQAQPHGRIQGGRFVVLTAPWAGQDVVLRLKREADGGAGAASAGGPGAFAMAAILRDETALAGAHDIEIRNGLAFIAGKGFTRRNLPRSGVFPYEAGKGGSLAIVEVSQPASPRLLWHAKDPLALEDAETVLPLGAGRLLVGTRDLFLFDTSRPAIPRQLAAVKDRTRVDTINGFARFGDAVFAANKRGCIFAVDVSAPDTFQLLGSRETRECGELSSPHDAAFCGDLLVVVSREGFGSGGKPGRLGVYRVADAKTRKALPPQQWSLVGRIEHPRLAGANRVRVRGRLAIVGSSLAENVGRADGLRSNVAIVDLGNPASPRLRGSVDFPDARGPNGLELAGAVAFAAGGQTVQALDTSDPDAPRELAHLTAPEAFPGGKDDAHDLVYHDGHLFVTAQTSHSLVVLRARDK